MYAAYLLQSIAFGRVHGAESRLSFLITTNNDRSLTFFSWGHSTALRRTRPHVILAAEWPTRCICTKPGRTRKCLQSGLLFCTVADSWQVQQGTAPYNLTVKTMTYLFPTSLSTAKAMLCDLSYIFWHRFGFPLSQGNPDPCPSSPPRYTIQSHPRDNACKCLTYITYTQERPR